MNTNANLDMMQMMQQMQQMPPEGHIIGVLRLEELTALRQPMHSRTIRYTGHSSGW